MRYQVRDRIVAPRSGPLDAPELPVGTLAPDPVPHAERPQPIPLVRLLIPIVMVAAIAAMVGLMMLGGGALNPMMLIFPLMMGVSMLAMFAPQSPGDANEQRRVYLRQLGTLRAVAARNAHMQREHSFHLHPDPDTLWSLVGTPRMWARTLEDPETFCVRFGLGTTQLCTPIKITNPPAPEDADPVCAVTLRHVVRAAGYVRNTPVDGSFLDVEHLHLTGPHARDLARSLIAHLVFHHGPDLVGITWTATANDPWQWLGWLPHTITPEDAHLHIHLHDTSTGPASQAMHSAPRTITIDEDGTTAPVAGAVVMEVTDRLTVDAFGHQETVGTPDYLSQAQAELLARRLSGYRRLSGNDAAGSRDFLSQLGLAPIHTLTHEQLWRHRHLPEQLNVPFGTTNDGRALHLDLKESAHGGVGPHGLCIGATGSGKSELLRTLVTALALTHSPEDVQMVLVDFKGGATFLGLDKLPHTSAVITNLSAERTLVERMHDAISGEMNRRQEVLRAAGNIPNVTDYNNRAHQHGHPRLPALLIVVDEFSELLGQHAEFAELFAAVGRLGRSLGIHLLLASQRLDEGRLRGLDSHLSYRIGLKTFSASESRQVLGITDAYHLPATPGAGYLKTDADTVQRFQAAYVSGPCLVPATTDPTTNKPLARIQPFTGLHNRPAPTTHDTTLVATDTTLVDAAVELARQAGQHRNLTAHQVWLPPLPAAIDLPAVFAANDQSAALDTTNPHQLCTTRSLTIPIGIIDRPYEQRQDPLTFDLTADGGHLAICGGPQTGKTTALRTLVTALAVTHPTDLAAIYLIDFSHSLADLADLPHVAGIAHKDQPEKVRRIIDEVSSFIHEPRPGHTLLFIDGWHTITSDFDDTIEQIATLCADGPKAGIHVIITTQRWTIVRPAIRDLMTSRIELKLAEPADSIIDRHAQKRVPSQAPGRGLTPTGEQMLIARTTTQDTTGALSITTAAAQTPVPKLKTLPTTINRADLHPSPTGGLPIGIGGPRLATQHFDPHNHGHLICIGAPRSGRSTLISTLAHSIAEQPRDNARLIILDPRRTHLDTIDPTMIAAYSGTTTSATDTINALVATCTERLPGPDITPAELKSRSWWQGPELYLIIDDADLLPEGTLNPLIHLLPHARDIGLHIIYARKTGGISRALFSGFLSELKDQQPAALILSGDKEEGNIFGVRPSTQPPGRGTLTARGTTIGLIQVAQP
ncbi:type VII secretion protein EccCa [Corynebacterium aquilae]|uniref:FtsK domain-containing protein n=1 Tax=Corynebacterium aquilae DSM 44791 TaxID=1431546 RepID=A0A1L7CDZ9_9CORY|nr:type VII secretion protein EccCa [Corynebacterium aquilae]APT84071.1 hypothetical protein CAQU_02155 [Corynebacterium aquilae DSM 44791]